MEAKPCSWELQTHGLSYATPVTQEKLHCKQLLTCRSQEVLKYINKRFYFSLK